MRDLLALRQDEEKPIIKWCEARAIACRRVPSSNYAHGFPLKRLDTMSCFASSLTDDQFEFERVSRSYAPDIDNKPSWASAFQVIPRPQVVKG